MDTVIVPLYSSEQKEPIHMASRNRKRSKPAPEPTASQLIALRISASYLQALEEIRDIEVINKDDPDRTTLSSLIRRAIREFLERQGKLKTKAVAAEVEGE